MYIRCMIRTQIYLTEVEQDFLKKESDNIDISKAELIRRILDSFIESKEKCLKTLPVRDLEK